LVFISHDSRDAGLAEAFANLLSDVSGGTLKSFRSSDKKGTAGIEFGTEWYTAIMSQLGDATDVVALLTSHSIDRPWILYEAGVAKGKLDTNVLGIALGVPLERVSTGPFGQFQNCGDDEDSLTKLVIQLLKQNPDAAPREEAVRMQVRVFLEGVKKVTAVKSKSSVPAADETSVAKLFEEVKIMVRELPERIDDRVRMASGKRSASKYPRRIHPMMFEEFTMQHAIQNAQGGPAVVWLLFLSTIREDLPWLYELGLDLHRTLKAGDREASLEAKRELIDVLKVTAGSPVFREMMGPESEEVYFLVRRLPDLIDRIVSSLLEHVTTHPRSRRKKHAGGPEELVWSAIEDYCSKNDITNPIALLDDLEFRQWLTNFTAGKVPSQPSYLTWQIVEYINHHK